MTGDGVTLTRAEVVALFRYMVGQPVARDDYTIVDVAGKRHVLAGGGTTYQLSQPS